MSIQTRLRPALGAARERGQAMLLTVLLLAVGVASVIYTLATPGRDDIERDRQTAAALAQAKDALIGYAASDANRPGSLPCPDINTNNPGFGNVPNDGSADQFAGIECDGFAGVNVYIGRLPWRTLGLPDLRDGSGERLWYAVSRAFAMNPSCGGVPNGAACPLNSDTPGLLTIRDASGTIVASNVIAIVFAPGPVLDLDPALNLQNRGAANQNSVTHYLEGENANGDTTYITALAGAAFNDKLRPITSDALFSVVNIRVAKEAIIALERYRSGPPGYYPFANSYAGGAPYSCSGNLTRGRFPATTAGCGQTAWGTELPSWWLPNNWSQVTHYAISKSCGQLGLPLGLDAVLGSLLCGLATNIPLLTTPPISTLLALLGISFTDEPLQVTGITGPNGARALVIVSGRALTVPPQLHPCTSAAQCMEDAENADADTTYVRPSPFPLSNDRMALRCDSAAACAILP